MNDPDQACRLTEERITKLEKDKAQAERLAEESRMNKENVKRLAEEERVRAEGERVKAQESRKNEENAKRLAEEERSKAEESKWNAAEEKCRRLEVEAELQKLRARLEVHGQA